MDPPQHSQPSERGYDNRLFIDTKDLESGAQYEIEKCFKGEFRSLTVLTPKYISL